MSKFNQAVIWENDWTTETMARQLEKGNIDLSVVFENRKNIACRKAKEALDNLHGILQYAYEYWKHNFENRHYGSFLENELMEHWVLYEDD